MRKATRTQWILFSVITAIYLAFVIWIGNYWLLLGIPVIFDIYISKIIPWGAWKKSKNKTVRKVAEWVDAIIFALIAVYIINLFIFQNYKIPSSSLEKTLLVGDFLFVSKMSYGPRVPNTPLSFPLAQHTLPILNTKSYIEWPQWDYKRLKGFGEVKRNDIVVFNFPAGDTVALKRQDVDYHSLVLREGWENVNRNKAVYGDVVYRPVDRRENYVKRCIGLPGETLQIKDNETYIDGNHIPFPEKAQFYYYVETNGSLLTDKQFRTLDVSPDDYKYNLIQWGPNVQNRLGIEYFFQDLGIEPNESGGYNPVYALPLTKEAISKLEKSGWARSIHINKEAGPSAAYYPYGYDMGWDRDNFGPVWIPAKGQQITLTPDNIEVYKRCIVNYEKNTMEVKNNQVYINGEPATAYTFKYDYYFMMGDNRHNSLDSRSWGFVPEDHVVGKPILIWLSLDKDRGLFDGKIRWNRIFRKADS